MAKVEAWFRIRLEPSSISGTIAEKLTAELAKKGSKVQVSARWDSLFYTTPENPGDQLFAGTVIRTSTRGTIIFLLSCTSSEQEIAKAAGELFEKIAAPEDT